MMTKKINSNDFSSISDFAHGRREPERTCVSCEKKSGKDDFLRFVCSPEGRVICDIRKKMQSRGVYVCPARECVQKAIKKKVFSRFFKKEVCEPSLSDFTENIRESYESYLFGLMNMAFKSGKIRNGSSAVFDAADKGIIYLFMVANDTGRSVREKAERSCEERGIDIVSIPDKLVISERMGKAVAAVMAVTDGGFAESLKKGWRTYAKVKMW